jgi:hypothetical protein
MSVTLVTLANPLKPHEREVEHASAPLRLDTWLMQRWPGGVRGTLSVVIDGVPVAPEACEGLVLRDGQHVLLMVTPGGLSTIAVYVAKAVIAYMISKIVSAIFGPKKPTALVDQPQASPVYSISGSQNAARLGEPIPVGYGEVIQVPDFGSQPYTYFLNHDQYLDEILVIGQGEYEIREMFVGDSTIMSLEPGIVQWWHYPATAHLTSEGVIEDQLTESSGQAFYENVVSSPEVGDQELRKGAPIQVPPDIFWAGTFFSGSAYGDDISVEPPGTEATYAELAAWDDAPEGTERWVFSETFVGEAAVHVWSYYTFVATAWHGPPYPEGSILPPYNTVTPSAEPIGWFDCCKPGRRGNRIMFDFVFPQGIYTVGESSLESRSCVVAIEYQRINDLGAPIGTVITQTETFTESTVNPRRYTLTYDLPTPGRYRARCTRTSTEPSSTSAADRVMWTGLKFRIVRQTEPVYGDQVTLACVRIKATNGIASAATSRIRFRVRRMLRPLGDPALEMATTRNPADAFVDIYTDTIYGAARDRSEVDLPALAACRSAWYVHNGFNAVFAQRSTVFEALTMALQVVAAGPLPVGGLMSVQVDSVKDSRVAMFTEANLRDLVVGYEFDKIGEPVGVRIEYRSPESFTPAYVVLPEGEIDVENSTLFGCTDETTAGQYAQLMLNRKQYQRKTATFDTELEGLMLLPGDRIAIQHQMPRWGQVGIVDEVTEGEAEPDPTTLLVHADTDISDASLNDATLTVGGGAQVVASPVVFGAGSLALDGVGDYVATPAHARYDLGAISAATNHTWRVRARWGVAPDAGTRALLSHGAPGNSASADLGGFMLYEVAGKLGLKVSQNAATSAAGDPSFSSVVALLHMDGADGSVVFTDSAATPNTFTVNGHAQIDTAQSKFGGASMLLDGTGDWIESASFGPQNFATGDWTIELWVRPNAVAVKLLVNKGITTSFSPFLLYLTASNQPAVQGHNSATGLQYNIAGAGALSVGTWYHVAAVRDGNTIRLYLNGVQVNSVAMSATLYHDSAAPLSIGAYENGTNAFNGWIDEVRITKGVCRYPSGTTFSVPTAPFPAALAPQWSDWRTTSTPIAAPSTWYALAFVIEAGEPHIYVDGVEQAGAFVAGVDAVSSFIGLDTTREDLPLRIGALDPAAAPLGDPHWSNVVLLLHGDGTNGGTVFTDSSPSPKSPNVSLASTSTAQSKFGGSSIRLTGTSGQGLKYADNAAWTLGSGAFTVEFFVRFDDSGTQRMLFAQADFSGTAAGSSIWIMRTASTDKIEAYAFSGSAFVFITSSSTVAANTWHHIAFVRSGSTYTLYIDGVSVGTVSSAAAINDSSSNLGIGSFGSASGLVLLGYIDELRFTVGVARTITVPTRAYPGYALDSAAVGLFEGWLDELHVIPEAAVTGDYTPESAPFPDPEEGGGEGGPPVLHLDRGLDWDNTPEPHAVLLSSELNGVSASIECTRGDDDHIVVLAEAPPFDLFGKGQHQEQTRVAFGTMGYEVRDWIVTATTPNAEVGVHVEALTYDPRVYEGAMPHQGFPPTEGEIPVGAWIVAGTPEAPSLEVVGAGEPADELPTDIVGGTPTDPSAEL